MNEKINLSWDFYKSHCQEIFANLLESQKYSDVTLVSDDQYQFKAHKFMLGASSSVFHSILDNDIKHSIIYLRGIQHTEIALILQYVYQGRATLHQENLKDFFEAAKDLGIRELGGIDTVELKYEQNVKSESFQNDNEISLSDQYDFEVSKKQQSNITQNAHMQSNYEGNIKYPCQQCDHHASTKSNLNAHIQLKHVGKKFPCARCDHQATTAGNLKAHVQYMHEGVRYPCKQCKYQATTPSHLKTHIMSVHEGIRFQCQKCDFEAAQRGALKNHINSKHLY